MILIRTEKIHLARHKDKELKFYADVFEVGLRAGIQNFENYFGSSKNPSNKSFQNFTRREIAIVNVFRKVMQVQTSHP